MHAIYIQLVCITTFLSPIWAENSPYSDLKINIFNKNNQIQTNFYDAIKEIEEKFDEQKFEEEIKDTLETAATVAGRIPFVGEIFNLLSDVINLAAGDEDWKSEVKDMIRKEIETQNPIIEIDDVLKEFRRTQGWMDIIKSLNKTNDNYAHHVVSIYKNLQAMIDVFSDFGSVSHQKPYPLVGAQVLIALSLAIAAFEPIAVEQMPTETKLLTLPCQAYDLLIDYRKYAVDARLDKLSGIPPENLVDVKNAPYNPEGYPPMGTSDTCKHNDKINYYCVGDQFGTTYCNIEGYCHIGYAQHVRHQVEKMFPVEQLKQACQKEWPEREPTGKNYSIQV